MTQFKILSAHELLLECRLDPLLNEWRSLSGFDDNVFNELFVKPYYQFCELVQLAPASENHHHADPGGMIKHTYDVILLALKKRRGYQLPLGGSISEINEQKLIWTYAVFVACLLHDVGKLSSSIRLIGITSKLKEKRWSGHSSPLKAKDDLIGYRIAFEKTPYEFHHQLALTHFAQLIPQSGRGWLVNNQVVMSQLCAYLWGDRFESGVIGEIVEFADQESTARALQIPANHKLSNAIPAIDRYVKMIRVWIADGVLRINSNGGMGWVDSHGNLFVVCRALAEKIIQECESLGLKNLPQEPVRIYDILQEHGYAIPTPDGKAIWHVTLKTKLYEHQLTCLKFEARRFTTPTKMLQAFDGEINARALKPQEAEQPTLKVEPVIARSTQEMPKQKQTVDTDSDNKLTDTPVPEAITREADKFTEEIEGTGQHQSANESTEETAETERPVQESVETKEDSLESAKKFNLDGTDAPRRFISWLKHGLIEKTLVINDVSAEVHIVPEGILLLAPAIFKTFLNKHGYNGEENHKNFSRRFARLRVHTPNKELNIHTYWVKSSNRASKINGWLLPFNLIYENDYPIPKPNKFIRKELSEFETQKGGAL